MAGHPLFFSSMKTRVVSLIFESAGGLGPKTPTSWMKCHHSWILGELLYPSSHNHGSGKWVYLQYDRFLSFRVIFHWTMITGESVGFSDFLFSPPSWGTDPICAHIFQSWFNYQLVGWSWSRFFHQLFGRLPPLHLGATAVEMKSLKSTSLQSWFFWESKKSYTSQIWVKQWNHQGVSKNRGTLKSSILIGFSIINHPFWGTPIFGNTHHHSQDWQ